MKDLHSHHRLAQMEAELAAVRAELDHLRAQLRPRSANTPTESFEETIAVGTEAAARPPDGPDPPERASGLDRRRLLTHLAAAAAGGAVVAVTNPTHAGAGDSGPIARGPGRALETHTQLSGAGSGATVEAVNTASGAAVYGHTAGSGNALVGECHDVTNTESAVLGVNHGPGNSLFGYKPPGAGGDAVVGIANSGRGVVGIACGGVAVAGSATRGRGGAFAGDQAQVRLHPSDAVTHPAIGLSGDLFLDRSSRLWLCRERSSWVRIA